MCYTLSQLVPISSFSEALPGFFVTTVKADPLGYYIYKMILPKKCINCKKVETNPKYLENYNKNKKI
jgi:hypothetical protein